MLRIAVCDDEKIYADMMSQYILKILAEKGIESTVKKFNNPKELLLSHEQKEYDILFLDIDMPEITGFDISESIRKTKSATQIIYISAKRELVYKSFDYSPFYFICKSTPSGLHADMKHVIDKLISHIQQHRVYTIHDTDRGDSIIRISEIIYIMSEKHYLNYYTTVKSSPFIERNTIANAMEELDCPDFIKPHQRYLVNLNHITKFGELSNGISVTGGAHIPVSKTYKEQALKAYMTYKRI